MLRKWMFLFLMFPLFTQAQQSNLPTLPPFKQYNIISPANLIGYDGKTFTKNDLPKNKSVVVVLFSVECDHCEQMTEALLKDIEKFKGSTLLMVTPVSLERMKAWYERFQIQKYSNIIMAAEPTRQIIYYYDLTNFPGIYIYDKRHKLLKDYEGAVKLESILRFL
jgi:thioredoxin-related protein